MQMLAKELDKPTAQQDLPLLERLLARTILFKHLPVEVLRRILPTCTSQSYPCATIMDLQGNVHIVLKGSLMIRFVKQGARGPTVVRTKTKYEGEHVHAGNSLEPDAEVSIPECSREYVVSCAS